MASTINASTSAGLVQTADTSGVLALQTANTTAVTLDASQNATFAGSVKTNTLTSAASTALTLQSAGTTAVTIDTSQNATFAQAIKLSYSANSNYASDGALSNYASTNGVYLNGNAAGWLRLNGDGTNASYIQITGASYSTPNQIQFFANGSQRATIDSSGRVCIGVTSAAYSTACVMNVNVDAVSASGGAWVSKAASTSTAFHMNFQNGNGGVGGISTSGSATQYVTSSDYRLKNSITPMTGALAKVAQLKPVIYKWNSDNSDGEGFIAHELAEICPHAVTGEKDAIDADGNPKYQGIDVSFLVATLTAAIQELKQINDTQAETINALTARIVALESK
jgi:hypothetical protein